MISEFFEISVILIWSHSKAVKCIAESSEVFSLFFDNMYVIIIIKTVTALHKETKKI